MARTKKTTPLQPYRFITALTVGSMAGILLLLYRVVDSGSFRYVFLAWNLILAAIAPILAWWLVHRIKVYGWLRWQQIVLTLLWFVFLPNSFYVVTDFIHLRQTYEASLLYDIVLLNLFAVLSMIMGFVSVYAVHKELAKRLDELKAWGIIGGIFLASSFAICLGRFTRWNTWDIVLKPAGLLFDVSDRFVNPGAHGETYTTTLIFFLMLLSLYWVIWEAVQYIVRRS